MSQTGRINFSRMESVTFGRPAAGVIAEEARLVGASRVFLMVSNTLNNKTDEIDKVRRALGNLCAGTYDTMSPHTPRSDVIAATRMARDANADLIVTVGGGSITDGAKAVLLCLANNINEIEGLDVLRPVTRPDGTVGPSLEIKAPKIKQITVPTTLSGGEFSAISGVTDERSRVKELIRHPDIVPASVVLDAAVTVHTPEWLWLSTGIRAVDHCVEAVCANSANHFGDAQSLQGLKLLHKGLQRIHRDPSNVDARLDCQMGAWLSMGALATGTPMGASHGIGYVLGAAFDVPHGHTSCIMLPAVMHWNKLVNAERQLLVSEAMGNRGEDAGGLLDKFIAGLGMPRSLSSVKIGPENFGMIAEQSMETPWVPLNPRPIDGPAQVKEILEIAA